MCVAPTWEGGEEHLRQGRAKEIKLQEGSPQCKRDGGEFWQTDERHMALTATSVGSLGVSTPSCPAWGRYHQGLLKTLQVSEKQVDTNWRQSIRLNKGYYKRIVHSRPHTCSSIHILFPSERRQHALSIAEPKPESSCFFLSPHTSIESPNSDTVHSSQTTPPFLPSSRALVSACRTAFLKSFFNMVIGVTKPDCKISLYRLPYRETSAAHGPKAQLEHSKLSATLPQLQGSFSDTPDYFASSCSLKSKSLMPPALAQADCSLNNSHGD